MSTEQTATTGLSAHQRAAGVAAATAARRARAELKKSMDFSSESLRRAVDAAHQAGPEAAALARMPMKELLAAMPGVGPKRAEQMLQAAEISPARRLGGLGKHQVQRLGQLIEERAHRRRRTVSQADSAVADDTDPGTQS